MIKVICKDNDGGYYKLTIDKIYDVIKCDTLYYTIENDIGEIHKYYKKRFISLANWRDEQINSILNDE